MAGEGTLEALAGKLPDGQVADQLGVDVAAVKAWRKEHGVEPYRRGPPAGGSSKASAAPGGKAADAGTRRRAVVRRRGGDAVEPVAWREEPAEPAPVEAAVVPRATTRSAPARSPGRPSASARLDAVRDQLGKVADDVIADQVGVSRGVVGAYRRKHGIAAYAGYLFQTGHAPLTGGGRTPRASKPKASPKPKKQAPAVSASASAPRTSRIDAVAHLVGVESDAAVAAKAGVSRTAVTAWRRRHGVTAMQPRSGPRPARTARVQSAAAPAATAAPAPAPAPAAAAAPAAPGAPAKPRATGALRAYAIQATAGGVQREFVAVGQDMGDACGRAQAGFDVRRDGPWLVDTVRLLGEAFA